MPRGLSTSAKMVYLSARPSPSVSTRRTTRPRPFTAPCARLRSTPTYTEPSGAGATAVGYMANGGPAKLRRVNPSGAFTCASTLRSYAVSRGMLPLFGREGPSPMLGWPWAAAGVAIAAAVSTPTASDVSARGRRLVVMTDAGCRRGRAGAALSRYERRTTHAETVAYPGRAQGCRSRRIVRLRTLVPGDASSLAGRTEDGVSAGCY